MIANIAKVLAVLKLFGPAVMIAHGFKMSGCALGKAAGVLQCAFGL